VYRCEGPIHSSPRTSKNGPLRWWGEPLEILQLELVELDLQRLESLLAESVIYGDDYLDSVTTHLIYAGGKRLRPMLAIASATGGAREASRETSWAAWRSSCCTSRLYITTTSWTRPKCVETSTA